MLGPRGDQKRPLTPRAGEPRGASAQRVLGQSSGLTLLLSGPGTRGRGRALSLSLSGQLLRGGVGARPRAQALEPPNTQPSPFFAHISPGQAPSPRGPSHLSGSLAASHSSPKKLTPLGAKSSQQGGARVRTFKGWIGPFPYLKPPRRAHNLIQPPTFDHERTHTRTHDQHARGSTKHTRTPHRAPRAPLANPSARPANAAPGAPRA